jgi:predicted cation transporter
MKGHEQTRQECTPVVATSARVEEAMVGAVPVADTIVFVLAGMRVHDVAKHIYSILVRFINQSL